VHIVYTSSAIPHPDKRNKSMKVLKHNSELKTIIKSVEFFHVADSVDILQCHNIEKVLLDLSNLIFGFSEILSDELIIKFL
jgi:hypothetical protein